MSEAKGSKLFDRPKSDNSSANTLHEDEAEAVAKAIGLTASSSQAGDVSSRPLSKDSSSGKGGSDNEEDNSTWRTSGSSAATFNPLSPASDVSSVAVKSPSLQPLDSPAVSDAEGEQSDDEKTHDGQQQDAHTNDGSIEHPQLPTTGEDNSGPDAAMDTEISHSVPSTSGEKVREEQKSSEGT